MLFYDFDKVEDLKIVLFDFFVFIYGGVICFWYFVKYVECKLMG